MLPAIAGSQEKWNGGIRYDYTVGGRNATVVVPQVTAPGSPWIWRPAWNGHKYYCAAINRILDASTRPVAEYVMKPHAIPDGKRMPYP